MGSTASYCLPAEWEMAKVSRELNQDNVGKKNLRYFRHSHLKINKHNSEKVGFPETATLTPLRFLAPALTSIAKVHSWATTQNSSSLCPSFLASEKVLSMSAFPHLAVNNKNFRSKQEIRNFCLLRIREFSSKKQLKPVKICERRRMLETPF